MEPIQERVINLHIEKLPEGVYLATSKDVPGLVAQANTIADTIEIAKDVAKEIFLSYLEHGDDLPAAFRVPAKSLDTQLAIGI